MPPRKRPTPTPKPARKPKPPPPPAPALHGIEGLAYAIAEASLPLPPETAAFVRAACAAPGLIAAVEMPAALMIAAFDAIARAYATAGYTPHVATPSPTRILGVSRAAGRLAAFRAGLPLPADAVRPAQDWLPLWRQQPTAPSLTTRSLILFADAEYMTPREVHALLAAAHRTGCRVILAHEPLSTRKRIPLFPPLALIHAGSR